MLPTPHIINAPGPNAALADALWWLKTAGVVNKSRNGRVVQAPGPVLTVYTHPTERVMFSPLRDANPFFHLYESLWMLAGRNDAASVSYFAKQMDTFSDDGLTLHGAYGFRWREWFGFDQLLEIVKLLRRDPLTRRAVLTMWSPIGDMIAAEGGAGGIESLDVPCNTQVFFDLTSGELNMTVLNRSNDVVWGAYGANVVHMSMLQEYVACAVGAPVGVYYQFSNNFHMYLDREDCQRLMSTPEGPAGRWAVRYTADDRYRTMHVGRTPLFALASEAEQWLEDCGAVADFPTADHVYRHAYFRRVAVPLMQAYGAYKDGDLRTAVRRAQECAAVDWRMAAVDWLRRRADKRAAAEGEA